MCTGVFVCCVCCLVGSRWNVDLHTENGNCFHSNEEQTASESDSVIMNAANGFIIMRKPVFPHIAYIHVIELVLVALRHMSSISSVNEGEKRKKKWRRGTRSAHTTLIARLLDSVAAWMSLIWFKYTDFLNYKIAPSTSLALTAKHQ